MSTPGNSINEITTGVVGFTGTAFTGSPATQYNVQVGGASSDLLSNVAPSATSGVPLVSAGSSADPAFGTAGVAGGGTGNTTFTAYSVITAGTTDTGAFQNVSGVGTSGQLLTSNGAAALPTWEDAAGGGGAWELISTTTASDDATIDFINLSSTYIMYMWVITDFICATDDEQLLIRTSTNNGVAYDSGSSDYRWADLVFSDNASQVTVNDNGDSSITIGFAVGNNTNETGTFVVNLTSHATVTYTKILCNSNYRRDSGETTSAIAEGQRISAADVDAIRFLMSSGNITSGTFKLYGLNAS